ncbi:MAG: kelch repeat-containing protein [Planctomycetota bacterium]|nr:kelch repeat-containing protein [Planctomycetota bacterium]
MKFPALLLLSCLAIADCPAQSPDWTRIQPTTSPFARTRHAMAYDSDRKVTVLFGGRDITVKSHGDTWEYDGKTWTEIKPSLSPSARTDHHMIYDSVRKLTVLYGGVGMRDTWTWDGTVWTKIKIPAANKPSARNRFAMAFDQSRGRIVLFGGYDTTKGLVDDTWEFDGTIWHKMTSLITTPPGRTNHAMAYDSVRKSVVLFSGVAAARLSDTWEWNGVFWRQVTTASAPSARRCVGCLTFDAARRRIVLFGGNSGVSLDDTWEYDGKDWTQITTSQAPRGREQHRMVFDSARGRVVLFGGSQDGDETWEYWGGSSCSMTADVPTVSITTGGAQKLTLDAGPAHANRPYWIFGSITGTSPGISLNGIKIPLNIDVYTQLAMENVMANPPFNNFRSVLDANGGATAQFVVPANVVKAGFTLYHAYIVFDAAGTFHCASNAVSVTLQ